VYQSLCEGEVVNVGLYAVSDNNPLSEKSISSMEVILQWDPSHLELLGNNDPSGDPDWQYSGFFIPDAYGLNELSPPQDGDGIYFALVSTDSAAAATPDGALITTFQFLAVGETNSTPVAILESAGSPPGRTRVFSGAPGYPNLEVTGTRSGASIRIAYMACLGDINGDGQIGLSDLGELLSNYNTTSGAGPDDGDLDCDQDVDLSDLAELLAVYDTTCD
jgi:hypothetical protein